MERYLVAPLVLAAACCLAAASRPMEQQRGDAVLSAAQLEPTSPTATAAASQSAHTVLPPPAATGGPLRKRGVGSTHLTVPELEALKGLAWWYSWGPRVWNDSVAAAAAAAGVHFVPMQWGQGGVEELAAALQPGSRVLLGFNEPNHREQAGMTPEEAAALWPQLEALADRLDLRLGSPAAAPCGRDCIVADPFVWLDQFFAACHGCRVDFMAAHYYACNPGWLRAYLQQGLGLDTSCRKYGRPVWLTEFACPNPHEPPVNSLRYMAQVLPMLDRDGFIEKYAWFALQTDGWLGTSNSLINTSTNELTDLGKLYVSLIADQGEEQQFKPGTGGGGGGSAPESSADGSSGGSAPESSADGSSGGSAPETSADGSSGGGASWSQLCAPCIAHLQGGRQLAELPAEERRYCGESCGFWAEAPGLLSRSGQGLLQGAAAEA
ncbi:hypothetical protein ABPG75_011806 [Micractinium tetrahymenae]